MAALAAKRVHLLITAFIAFSAMLIPILLISCAPEEAVLKWQPVSRLEEYLAASGSDLQMRAVRFGPPARVKEGVTARIKRSVLQPVTGEVEWKLTVPQGETRLEFTLGFQCEGDATAGRVGVSVTASTDGESPERIFEKEVLVRPSESGLVFSDESVALDRFGGRELALGFECEALDGAMEGVSIAWGNPVVLSKAESGRPNVVLICVDTLRRDRVGVYNPESRLTPVLDALAADGVVYEHAIAQSPWTLPSVSSVLTGLFPSLHGGGKRVLLAEQPSDGEFAELQSRHGLVVRQGGDAYGLARLRGKFVTLPQVLGSHYVSHVVNGNAFLSENVNVINRFQSCDDGALHGNVLTRNAVGWLDSNDDSLFFLYAHYMEPHQWYDYYADLDPGVRETGEYVREIGWRAYDEMVRIGDRYVGDLLDDLKRRGLYDGALIVFYSDHGEMLWDDGSTMFGHGNTLRRQLLEIPLIVKFPRGEHAGVRVSGRVMLRDIFDTIAREARVPLDLPDNWRGASLRESAESNYSGNEREIFSEFKLFGREAIAVQKGRFKLVRDLVLEKSSLFEAGSDRPFEVGESGEYARAVERLERLLERYFRLAEKEGARPKLIEVDEDERERLRQIGYIQ